MLVQYFSCVEKIMRHCVLCPKYLLLATSVLLTCSIFPTPAIYLKITFMAELARLIASTPIPRIARVLVCEKNCVTEKMCQQDCTSDSTKAEFPYLRQNPRNWKPRSWKPRQWKPRYTGTKCIFKGQIGFEKQINGITFKSSDNIKVIIRDIAGVSPLYCRVDKKIDPCPWSVQRIAMIDSLTQIYSHVVFVHLYLCTYW